MRPRPVSPFRALTGAFFARFLESDLTASADDLKRPLFYLVAALAMPGLFAPLLMQGNSPTDPAGWGWSMIAQYRGADVLRVVSRADKTFYLAYAMVASALVSLLTWTTLVPDRRDSLILGALPVRPAAVVRAKLVALLAYVGLVTASMHALASLSFGAFLAAGSGIGFAIRGIAAHFLASLAAGTFVLLTIAALQGATLALVGPRRFARFSSLLQLATVAGVVVFVALVTGIVGSVAETLAGSGGGRPWIFLTPPLWFLGLYETILGTSDPVLVALARTAVLALGGAAVVTVCSYPLAYRRLMTEAVAAAPRARVTLRFLTPVWGLTPAASAAFQFFVATLRRSPRHRFVVAAALGLAAPWAIPPWLSPSAAATVSAAPLALALAVMVCALAGVRAAAVLPSALEPAWLFDLAPIPRREARRAVERVMLAGVVGPIVVSSGAQLWYLRGAAAGGVHALIAIAVGMLFVQLLLWRYGDVPCTSPWTWRALRWGPGFAAGGLMAIRGVPPLEELLFREPAAGALCAAYVLALAWGIRTHAAQLPAREASDAVDVLTSALRAGSPGVEPAGDVAAVRHEPVGQRRWTLAAALTAVRPFPGELGTSVVLAARRLVGAPVFTAFSILTLASGIGLTTATYSVLRAVLWVRPPVSEPERLVDLSGFTGRARSTSGAFSLPDFEDLQARQSTLSGLAAATVMTSTFVADGVAELVTGEAVNGNYFRTFGVRPRLGRAIEPEDDRPGAVPVAVLSYNLWRLRFAGDPGVIGRAVKIDRQVHQVVGVAPEHFGGWEFGFRSRPPAIWVPLRSAAGEARDRRESGRRDFRWIAVKARLAPGRSIEQASVETAAIGRGLEADFPTPGSTSRVGSGRRWSAGPLVVRDPGGASFTAWASLAAVGLVLLIGCTTLANLALARGASREQERGVQRALGASRGRLVREQLVESLLVTAAGGLVAVPIVGILMAFARREIPLGAGQYVLVDPHVDVAVLVFAAGASVLGLAVSGIWPALQLTRPEVWSSLASAGPATARGVVHRRLIAGQVAGSMALFLVAAACIHAIVANGRHDSGVDIDRLAMVRVGFDVNRRDEAAGRRIIDQVLGAARRVPGIDAVAATSGLPFGMGPSGSWSMRSADGTFDEEVQVVAGTPALLATLGVPLLGGRRFDDRDRQGSVRVGIVSVKLARQLAGATDPVGRSILLVRRDPRSSPAAAEPITIVGVAGDTDAVHLGSRDIGVVYVPLDQNYRDSALFTVRTSGDPAAAVTTLKSVLQQVDPDLAVDLAQTASQALGPYGALAVVAAIVTTFGSIALVLTMAGLFGVVSQIVSGRMRELGVRMALGAGRPRIVALVLADGLRPVGHGLGLGLVLGAIGRMAIGSFIGRPVTAVDPVAFVVVPILLVVAAIGACYLPARRAACADPGVALRRP